MTAQLEFYMKNKRDTAFKCTKTNACGQKQKGTTTALSIEIYRIIHLK